MKTPQNIPFSGLVRSLHRSRELPLLQSAIGSSAGHTYMPHHPFDSDMRLSESLIYVLALRLDTTLTRIQRKYIEIPLRNI